MVTKACSYICVQTTMSDKKTCQYDSQQGHNEIWKLNLNEILLSKMHYQKSKEINEIEYEN